MTRFISTTIADHGTTHERARQILGEALDNIDARYQDNACSHLIRFIVAHDAIMEIPDLRRTSIVAFALDGTAVAEFNAIVDLGVPADNLRDAINAAGYAMTPAGRRWP